MIYHLKGELLQRFNLVLKNEFMKNYIFKKRSIQIFFISIICLYPKFLDANEIIPINNYSFIDVQNCYWIPINSRNFKSLKNRICKSSNNDVYQIKYNTKTKRTLSKKLIGNLKNPLVFKDKKNLINQNKDTLKYSRLINGDYFVYSCQRKYCNPISSNFKKLGFKKYYWD